ncbi:acid phosphatase [Gluconobacter oxydans]|uniref:Acid phosphatase n=1 Tax=Gluconobacter oxydans NBRC 3293 TaxID=1315969 RepID=A0A829WY63_GLUOY|nr:phosphatase PAP2 family protein [Gluconobacter oxydans]GEM15872.1 nonspecific acid phosphatase [Gluconobacter oxydans NBRC 3293]
MSKILHTVAVLSACGILLSACSTTPRQTDHIGSSLESSVDARLVLPPPPVAGGAAQADDDRVFHETRALQGTPRWTLAQHDANLHTAQVVRSFSCAVGTTLELTKMSHFEALAKTTRKAIMHRTSEAKNFWHRTRPFVGTDLPVCTPTNDLGPHSSYPSGHATEGYSVALLLAHLLPERASLILQRGRVFGESRIVCGAHWKSDVVAGLLNASTQMDALLAQPALQPDLAAARQELQTSLSHAVAPPAEECAAEADAAAHSILPD